MYVTVCFFSALYLLFWGLSPNIHSNTLKNHSHYVNPCWLVKLFCLSQVVLPTMNAACGRYHLMEVNIGEDEYVCKDLLM